MYDFLLVVKEFGITIALFAAIFIILYFIIKWLNKLDTKIKRHSHIMEEIKNDVGKIHIGCHIPIGAVRKLEEKVTALELQDARLDGDLKKIDEHLKTLDNSMTEIKTDVKTILNHFATKGMDK